LIVLDIVKILKLE